MRYGFIKWNIGDNLPLFVPVDSNEIASWAFSSILYLYNSSIIKGSGDGRIHPRALVTRAEAAQLLYNILMYERDY